MSPSSKSSLSSAMRWVGIGAVTLVAGAVGASGCLQRPLCASADEDVVTLPEGFSTDCDPRTTNVFVDTITQTSVDKIDLLFMIDNSISMADKQEILKAAVPDLAARLVNPVCVNNDTGEQTQPPGSIDEPCPAPYVREFSPIRDIHIGVVSSSLGSYGAPACDPAVRGEQNNDHGRMVGARPRAFVDGLQLANGNDGTPGFLIWDVTNGQQQDLATLQAQFQQLVVTTGEQGCGYEASLEAWYRFLVDPNPPEVIATVQCPGGGDCAQPQGTDAALLAQRQQFLRSDSLLAIVMLSDENDCSIQGTGQLYYAARDISLPASSQACANNPNDPCCYSCAFNPPADCTAPDPTCTAESPFRRVPDAEDNANLRCWDQKKRFGVDFLYPVKRYVNALTQPQICTGNADLSLANCPVQPSANPLFQDLSGAGGSIRDSSLVFLAGIVGVPWQDIAADVDKEGTPWPQRVDNNGDGAIDSLNFLTASQMSGLAMDGTTGRDTWSLILGSPEASPPLLPLDTLMHETIFARSGQNPPTGAALTGPGDGYLSNPVNGHEWNVVNRDDLQYACIFPLTTPKDCVQAEAEGKGCDCLDQADVDAAQNPLCQQPDGSYSQTQRFAKGYPGLRFLHVLRDFGANSIVASICPANTVDPNAPAFGYRPAVGALIDRLKDALQGKCLPRELDVQGGTVPCSIVEAVPRNVGCGRPGRKEADSLVVEPAFRRLQEIGRCGTDGLPPCDQSAWTLCEINESTDDSNGDGARDCLQDGVTPGDVGWCYVDPAKGLGDPALIDNCPATEPRILRFVDKDSDTPTKGATVLIACLGAPLG